jgi:MFS family permease
LREIVMQPRFAIAALVAATSYGLMNLLMTATPLAMDFCSYPYGLAVLVIQWHVVGMYAPAFITGNLMKRFSVLQIIGAGLAVMVLASLVALHGVSVSHFMASMLLVGLGWNFMYTGGTLLLTDAYTPAERAQAQGANDFFVFAVMGVSSFTSGALISGAGWAWMNWLALIVLVLVSTAVAWFAHTRPSPSDDAAFAGGR